MKNLHSIFSKKSIAKLLPFFLIINIFMFTDALVYQAEAAPIINDMNISTTDQEVSVYGTGDGNGVDLADKPFRYSIGSSQSDWVRDSSNISINETLTTGALSNTQVLSNSLTLASVAGSGITTGGGLEGYAYGNTIIIDHTKVDSELTNFTVTVYLNNTNFDFSKCKTDGSDIRFTDKDLNQLKFEKEEYNSVSGSAVINVLVPKVSNTQDTELMMWYGNLNAYNTSIEAWQDQTGKQLTYNGNVKLVPNVAKFGKALELNASGRLGFNASTDFDFGTGDGTIDFWLRTTGSTGQIIDSRGGTSTITGNNLYLISGGKLQWYMGNGGWTSLISNLAINDGKLHHIELTKYDNTALMFIDGKLDNSIAQTGIGACTGFWIGGNPIISDSIVGHIDEFRVSKGIARHTSDFTPSQEPYTADEYTKLLLHFDDYDAMKIATSTTVADSSYCSKTIPFLNTKTGVVEFKAKVETSGTVEGQRFEYSDGVKYLDVCLQTGNVQLKSGSVLAMVTMDTTDADHTYRLVVTGGTDCKLYVDNVLKATISYSSLTNNASNICYFGDGGGTNNGGSTVWKYVKYNVDYVTNPTLFIEWLPSQGLPSSSGWTINGTAPAGLFKDETGKATYTYGDVKLIKTAYADGTRSLYVDGSGDYLSCTGIREATSNDSDFTMESKVVFTSLPASGYTAMIYSKYSSSPLSTLYFGLQNSSGTYYLVAYSYGGGLVYQIPWTPALNTNYDIALIKDGNNFKFFINGQQHGTTLTTSTTLDTALSIQNSYIGYYGSSSYYFTGHILGLRITQDTARYSGTYTPPSKFEIDSDKVVFNSMFDTVYDSNYAMVQHMGNTLVDATGNGNNGTATGTTVVNTAYGKARYFPNNTGNYISIPNTFLFRDFTIISMQNLYSGASMYDCPIITSGDWNQTAGHWSYGIYKDTYMCSFRRPDYLLTYPSVYGEYYATSFKRQNSLISNFVDGGQIGNKSTTDNIPLTSNVTYSYIGRATYGPYFPYYGNINELRISNSARTDAWIKAESLSLKNELLSFAMYPTTGSRESEYDVSGNVNSSSLQWTQTTPTGTSITVESNVSTDGGISWLGWKTCTSGETIADLDGSTDTDNARLKLRQTLNTSSGAITPTLSNSIITIGLSKYVYRAPAAPNQEYTVTFEVKDATGDVEPKTMKVYTKAQTPQFTVGTKTENTMELAFSDNNPENTEYQIMCDSRYVNSSGVLTSVPTWITLEDKAITILGLNLGTMYHFTAKAQNTAEEETNYGSPIYAGTQGIPVPSGSAIIAATAMNNSVTVAWNEIPNSLSYELEMDGVIKNVGLKTNYVHKDLMTATQHTYRVRGRNQGGFSDWSELCIINTTSNLPLIPTNALAKASDDTVTVYWDTAQDALSYTMEVGGRQLTGVKKNSATLFGLKPETTYSYKVKACNLIGESEWTAEGSITTYYLETPKITLEETDSHQIKIGWDKIEGATSYKIALDANDNFDILSGSELDEFASSAAITYTHENLPIKTAHVYRICALSADGDSAWSDSITLETLPQRPEVPTNFSGGASDDFITLIWDAVLDAIGYDIEVDGVVVENDNVTEYQYKGLNQYTPHTYRVRAVTDEIESPWSNMLTISTSGGVPEEPKNVAITNSRGIATLTWDKTDGAQYYDVEVAGAISSNIARNSFTHRQIELITSSASIYTETAYRIRGCNDLGTSQWSDYYINNAIRGQIEKGKELELGLTASNIIDFSRYTMNVTYNEKALTVTDLCGYSIEKELGPGMVEGRDIEIVSFVPGHIVFRVSKIVDEGYLYASIINNIKFVGNATGGTTLSYTVQCQED